VQPQTADQMRRVVEVNVDKDLLIHLLPRMLALWLDSLRAPGTKINAFRQTFFFQRKANFVSFRTGQVAESLEHPKRKQHGSVGSNPYARIALFHLHKSGSGNKSSLSHDR
jgi:hypothetical protein